MKPALICAACLALAVACALAACALLFWAEPGAVMRGFR